MLFPDHEKVECAAGDLKCETRRWRAGLLHQQCGVVFMAEWKMDILQPESGEWGAHGQEAKQPTELLHSS